MPVNAMDWAGLATAVGTVGAAIFAGLAARVAAASAAASRDLVALERQRDVASAEASRWRQARRVTGDTRGQQVFDRAGEPVGWDVSTVVTNASTDPIFKTRIKIMGDDEHWGPQLTGTLAPGHTIEVIARILGGVER